MRSVIIPTYNHWTECLEPCLNSIKNTDLSNSEVVVVANGCKDGTEYKLLNYAKTFPVPIRMISCPDPLGYTVAVNVGIVTSKGETVVLMNDDIQILEWGKDWLKRLEDPLKDDEKLAITGANRDFWARGRYFLTFSLVAIKRHVLFEFGLLDEIFNPGCGEDTDFCLKIQLKGYKIRQVPNEMDFWGSTFPAYHKGHVTCNTMDFSQVAIRNSKILEERYPREAEDGRLGLLFSKGHQPNT